MIKKRGLLFTLASIITIGNLLAQIGINTEHPKSDLDVNGNIHVAGNLLVGGDDNTKGTAGTKNMLLISQGEGFVPQWKKIDGFEVIKDGKWYLTGTIGKIDNDGGLVLNFAKYGTGADVYNEGLELNQLSTDDVYDWRYNVGTVVHYWKEFKNMDFTIPASDKKMRVFITLQLPLQAFWPGQVNRVSQNYVSGAFGVFKESASSNAGNKIVSMVASMQGACFGAGVNNTPIATLTMITAFDIDAGATDSVFRILGTMRNTDVSDYNRALLYMGTDIYGDQSSRAAFNRLTLKVEIFSSVVE